MIVPIDPIINYENTGVFYENPNIGFNGQPLPVAINPVYTLPVKPNQSLAIDDLSIDPIMSNPIKTTALPTAPILSSNVNTATSNSNTSNPIQVAQTNNAVNSVPVSVRIVVTAVNSKSPLQLANVSVNGTPTAQTDINGAVILPNVKTTDDITVSYIGYQSQTFKAGNIPAPVILETNAILLDAVSTNSGPKPVKRKTNVYLWILGLVAGGFALNEMTKDNKKTSKLGSPNVVIAKV